MDTPDGIDTEKGYFDNTNSISIEPNYQLFDQNTKNIINIFVAQLLKERKTFSQICNNYRETLKQKENLIKRQQGIIKDKDQEIKRIKQQSEGEIKKLQYELLGLKTQKKADAKRYDDLMNKYQNLQSQFSQKTVQLFFSKNSINSYQAKINNLTKKLETQKQQYKKLKEQQHKIVSQIQFNKKSTQQQNIELQDQLSAKIQTIKIIQKQKKQCELNQLRYKNMLAWQRLVLQDQFKSILSGETTGLEKEEKVILSKQLLQKKPESIKDLEESKELIQFIKNIRKLGKIKNQFTKFVQNNSQFLLKITKTVKKSAENIMDNEQKIINSMAVQISAEVKNYKVNQADNLNQKLVNNKQKTIQTITEYQTLTKKLIQIIKRLKSQNTKQCQQLSDIKSKYEQQKRIRKQKQRQIQRLKTKVSQLQNTKNSLNQIITNNTLAIQRLQAQIKRQQTQIERQLALIKGQQTQIKSKTKQIQQHKQTINKLQKNITQINQKHQTQIKNLKSTQLKLREQHKIQIQSIQRKTVSSQSQLINLHKKQLQKQENKFKDQIKKQQNSYQDKIKTQRNGHQRQVSQMKYEFSEMKKQFETKIKELESALVPFVNQSAVLDCCNNEDKKQILFIKSQIQALTGKRVAGSRTVFRKAKQVDFHHYVDEIPNLMVLIKLINGTVLAGFATTPFVKPTPGMLPVKGNGFLYSSNSKKAYRLKQDPEVMAVAYNTYNLIWGNAQIKIGLSDSLLWTSFGSSTSYYDSKGDWTHNFTGGGKNVTQLQMLSFEVLQVRFQGQELVNRLWANSPQEVKDMR